MSKTAAKPLPEYDGPSLKEVRTFNLAKVNLELKRLNVEPMLTTNVKDEQNLIALWGDHADLENYKVAWMPEEIEQLRTKARALDLSSWQGQVFSAYLDQWAASLSDADAWRIVEDFEGVKAAVSERRYTSREKLQERVCAAIYNKEVTQS